MANPQWTKNCKSYSDGIKIYSLRSLSKAICGIFGRRGKMRLYGLWVRFFYFCVVGFFFLTHQGKLAVLLRRASDWGWREGPSSIALHLGFVEESNRAALSSFYLVPTMPLNCSEYFKNLSP